MKRAFLRFYLVLLLAMIAIALAVEGLLSSLGDHDTPWLPAEHLFCQQTPDEHCQQITAQWQTVDRDAIQLSDDSRAQLARGDIIALRSDDGQTLLVRQHEQHFQLYGPVQNNDDSSLTSLYLYLLFFGVFGLLLLFWLWPLFRDIDQMRSTLADPNNARGVLKFALPKRSVMQPLAGVITQLSQQAEHLLQTQRELSHFIAHDLRTPLARMRFALAMLDTPNTDLRKDLFDNIAELERTATEYLRYAEQEAQHSIIRLPQLNTSHFFTALEQHYRHSRKSIQFRFPPDKLFHADEFTLQRALCNLIDNAEQYATQHINITFTLRRACCILQVDDDGPGIPLAARQQFNPERAFDPARVRGNREQGFGLGLYIVRRVVMLHRAQLKMLSSPSGGARFQMSWWNQP